MASFPNIPPEIALQNLMSGLFPETQDTRIQEIAGRVLPTSPSATHAPSLPRNPSFTVRGRFFPTTEPWNLPLKE